MFLFGWIFCVVNIKFCLLQKERGIDNKILRKIDKRKEKEKNKERERERKNGKKIFFI